jgi:hypothetical protein
MRGYRVATGEGHCGGIALVNRVTSGRRRLPVDGLEAILEFARSTELPLADEEPDGGSTNDARGGDDKRDDDRPGKERGVLVLGLV